MIAEEDTNRTIALDATVMVNATTTHATTMAEAITTMPITISMAKATTIALASITITIILVVGTIAITKIIAEKEEQIYDRDRLIATLKMTSLKGNNTLFITK